MTKRDLLVGAAETAAGLGAAAAGFEPKITARLYDLLRELVGDLAENAGVEQLHAHTHDILAALERKAARPQVNGVPGASRGLRTAIMYLACDPSILPGPSVPGLVWVMDGPHGTATMLLVTPRSDELVSLHLAPDEFRLPELMSSHDACVEAASDTARREMNGFGLVFGPTEVTVRRAGRPGRLVLGSEMVRAAWAAGMDVPTGWPTPRAP